MKVVFRVATPYALTMHTLVNTDLEGRVDDCYKTFFMLSSAETKIYPAHKC